MLYKLRFMHKIMRSNEFIINKKWETHTREAKEKKMKENIESIVLHDFLYYFLCCNGNSSHAAYTCKRSNRWKTLTLVEKLVFMARGDAAAV